MGARAIWKGQLLCDETSIAVGLYSAVQDRTVRFNLLHDQDKVRLKLRLRNQRTDEVVEYADASRGFELEPGLVVVMNDEDLQSLEPEPSRDIEITRFVSPEAIAHPLYDRPYYLAPDAGQAAEYFALAQALDDEEKVGIAKWVMRKKSYVGALYSDGSVLMLITLRHADEVVRNTELDSPGGTKPSEKEKQLARQLVATLEDEFRPAEYRDEYRDRVLDLIESKRRGKRVKVKKFKPVKPKTKSLTKLLEASLSGGK